MRLQTPPHLRDQSNMTPVVTGTPGLLENTWVVHFQDTRNAGSASSEEATPVIMIGIYLCSSLLRSWQYKNHVSPYFPGNDRSDRQSAMEALKEGGFSPQLNRQSGQLEVDAGSYHEAKIYLASQGIPAEDSASGFEALSHPLR